MSTSLDAALRYYNEHGCVAFWNPRDITHETLHTDTPDVEALLIEPNEISNCEAHEGQYLVQKGKLQAYDPYPGHTGVDEVFALLKLTRPDVVATTVIAQCVAMAWVVMDSADGENGLFFQRYEPRSIPTTAVRYNH